MNQHRKATTSLLGITTGLFLLLTACGGGVSNTASSGDTSSTQSSSNVTLTAATSSTTSNSEASSEKAGLSSEIKVAVARVDTPAPDFTGTDANGKTVRLSDYKGKLVVLEWTNYECPFVRKHYGSQNMQKLQKEATDKGVVWLSVISSAPGQQGYLTGTQANQRTKTLNAAPTALILDPDGKIGKLYGARTTPHMYVIGKDGNMKYMGAIDSIPSREPADVAKADNYVRDALNAITAGKEVAQPTTQPYGCSVKYGS